MAKKELNEEIWCAKCDAGMKLATTPRYEYEPGFPLHNVESFTCPKCGKVFFTEEQARRMRQQTEEMKDQAFSFERTITVSGKSLVVGVPSELASHLHIKQGQRVRIIPLAKEGFLVKTGR